MSKNTAPASSSTSTRQRRACLNHIRKQLTIQYHALSAQACDDRISDRYGQGEPPNELSKGCALVSDAINCLNRELGRKENSAADGDGTR